MNKVKGKLDELSRERTQLNAEKGALQKEKEDLQQQVEELARSVEKLNRDKVVLERELEAEEEQVRRSEGVSSAALQAWQEAMLAALQYFAAQQTSRSVYDVIYGLKMLPMMSLQIRMWVGMRNSCWAVSMTAATTMRRCC